MPSCRSIQGLLIVALFLASSMLAAAQCPCNATSYDALVAFYEATSGPTRWSVKWDIATKPVCEWHGVSCQGTAGVVALALPGNGLVGTLPAALATLGHLVSLDLGANNIGGTLPEAYGRAWPHITSLRLQRCNLSGTLPAAYGNWSAMVEFDVASNRLNGTLPVEYKHFGSNVRTFWVSGNAISGSLHPEYDAWTDIRQFYVASNQLTGTLPSSYETWSNVQYFSILGNRLTGSIPTDYRAFASMVEFIVEDNLLTGTLPPEFGSSWRSPMTFRVGKNGLNSTLPEAYGNGTWGTRLVEFGAQRNRLTGSLPASYGSWVLVTLVNIGFNNLTGTLPAEYASWRSVSRVNLQRNFLSGPLPRAWGAAWGSLTALELQNNGLQGTLPPEFSTLANMTTLVLGVNRLEGNLPEAWSALRMKFLSLQDNAGLMGTIPTSWRQMFTFLGFQTGILSICRTGICGAAAAIGMGSFACIPIDAVDEGNLGVLINIASYNTSFPCSTPGGPTPSPFGGQPSATASHPEAHGARGISSILVLEPLRKTGASVFIWASLVTSLSSLRGASLSSSSSVALLQSAYGALRLRQRCLLVQDVEDNDDGASGDATPPLPSDLIDNPLGLGFGVFGAALGDAIGTLVGNGVVVVVVGMTMHAVAVFVRAPLEAYMERRTKDCRTSTLLESRVLSMCLQCLGEDCLPGTLLIPYALLLQPSVTAAVRLVAAAGASGSAAVRGARVVGVAACLVWGAPPFMAAWWLKYRVSRPFPLSSRRWAKEIESPREPLTKYQAWRHWLLRPKDVWRTRRGADPAKASLVWVRFVPLFRPYRGGRRMFFFVAELGLAIVSGVILGAADSVEEAAACTAALWGGVCLVALAACHVAMHLALRPLNVRIDAASALTIGVLAIAAEAASVANATSAAAVLVSIATLMDLSMILVGVAIGVEIALLHDYRAPGSLGGWRRQHQTPRKKHESTLVSRLQPRHGDAVRVGATDAIWSDGPLRHQRHRHRVANRIELDDSGPLSMLALTALSPTEALRVLVEMIAQRPLTSPPDATHARI